ncbi:hypothetical protein K4M08_18290, partial [Pseudomonas syringae pv. tomato]|nr:hypothetical protein [Pseudomonas syringae pv. tomato]
RTGHLDFTGCTVLTCFAAGSRQFADKSAPTKSEKSRTSEASPGPRQNPHFPGFITYVPSWSEK